MAADDAALALWTSMKKTHQRVPCCGMPGPGCTARPIPGTKSLSCHSLRTAVSGRSTRTSRSQVTNDGLGAAEARRGPPVAKILRISGLNSRMPVFATIEDAMVLRAASPALARLGRSSP